MPIRAPPIGELLVFLLFPKKDDEERLLTEYQSEDASRITLPAHGAKPDNAPYRPGLLCMMPPSAKTVVAVM